MDSSYFGEANQQERGRKSKKSSNSEKPKQPQRGLGVAQLEKIRLHDLSSSCAYQYPTYNFNNLEDTRVQTAYSSIPSSSSASYGFNNNTRMGLVHEYDKTNNIRLYGDSQPTAPPRWDISGEALILENQHNFDQPSMTSSQYPLNLHDSEHMQMVRGIDHGSNSLMGHSHRSPNSELSDDQEVDLELRLSL